MTKRTRLHPFESVLSVTSEEIEFDLRGTQPVPWADLLLNPRRLLGSDFLMRWSQGVWSEERLIQCVNDTGAYFALPYGPSSVAPDDDVRGFELYFERLDAAGLGQVKRPDLLIFRRSDRESVDRIVERVGGVTELRFTPESSDELQGLLTMSRLAVECENSLWRATQMPDYGSQLTPQARLGGHRGLKKTAVVPTVILKEEDRAPLREWQTQAGVCIHIWHVFYEVAFGIAFDRAEALIESGQIAPTLQTFQAPGGPTTTKTIYKIYYQHAYLVGQSHEEPSLVAACITDKNGHILPYVRFEGGSLRMSDETMRVLGEACQR